MDNLAFTACYRETMANTGITAGPEIAWCRTCWTALHPRVVERANILATATCVLLEHEVLYAIECIRHYKRPSYDYDYGTGYFCYKRRGEEEEQT